MIRTLLGVRFQALAAGMTAGKKKKGLSKGMVALYLLLLIYVVAVFGGMMYLLFDSLVLPYHLLELDWLYFAMAGTIAFGISLFGSIFSTENQLFDAKDNDLLLSMPIPPGYILISRILPLLSINLLFCAIVMVPAMIVYALQIGFSALVLVQVLSMVLICLLVQTFACLFGWLLHLALQKINRAFGSFLFMVIFLGIYFGVYSQASSILNSMAASGEKIASAMESWVWPLYAMGMGCTGSWHMLVFAIICLGAFALMYYILSVTFLKTSTRATRAPRRKAFTKFRASTPRKAIVLKELGKFTNTPVYLTNMGLGVILIAAIPVAALIFRGKITDGIRTMEQVLPNVAQFVPVIICAVLSFGISTACIATPSVSLEGKNIWILKSMPVSPRVILQGKLALHLLLTTPVASIGGLIMGLTFSCTPAQLVLVTLVPGLLSVFSGLLGMVTGTKWAKLDYLNEAYPCKQSLPVFISMFGIMGMPIVLGLGYYFLFPAMPPLIFLVLVACTLCSLCGLLYAWLFTKGIEKWESL